MKIFISGLVQMDKGVHLNCKFSEDKCRLNNQYHVTLPLINLHVSWEATAHVQKKVTSVIFSALLREDCVGYFEAYLTFICLNWFSFWLFFFVLFIHSVSDLLLCHADYSVLLFTLILLFLFCHFDFLSSRFHNLVLTHHFIFHKWWQKITNVKIEKF